MELYGCDLSGIKAGSGNSFNNEGPSDIKMVGCSLKETLPPPVTTNTKYQGRLLANSCGVGTFTAPVPELTYQYVDGTVSHDATVYRAASLEADGDGTYTFKVTPANSECKYWFGLTNMQGPFTGEATLTVQVEEKQRVTFAYSGGGRPESRTVSFVSDPLNGNLLVLEPTFWNSDHNGGFECVRDGRTHQNIPYQLVVSGGTGMQAGPAQKTEAGLPAILPKEIRIAPGTAWEGEFPAAGTVELWARIVYGEVAGAASLLEVVVYGQRVADGLRNKGGSFRLADGREFPYYQAAVQAWTLFYSPDFSANNTPAAGGYEVMTDPGEAYRYRWDVSSLVGPSPVMRVNLKHNGLVQAPVIIQFR